MNVNFFFSEACFDVFHVWMVKDRLPSKSQCGLWEATVPRRRQAVKLAKFLVFKHGKTKINLCSTSAKYPDVESTINMFKLKYWT